MSVNPAIEQVVLDRNNELVFASIGASALASNLIGVTLVVGTWGTLPVWVAAAWLLGGLFIAALRLVDSRAWARAGREQRRREAMRWRLASSRGALASGLWWSLGIALAMGPANETQRYFVGVLMAGLVSGAMLSLTAIPLAYRLFSMPPIATYFVGTALAADSRVDWMLALAIITFVPVLLRGSRQVSEMMNHTIRLASEQATLVVDLQQARDSALASARARSEFLAVMSHEIRTPLAGVVGMTGLLLDSPLTAEQRDFAGAIEQSAEALRGLIDNILDFSKVDAGRIELELRDFDLPGEFRGLGRLMAFKAEEKHLPLDLHLASDLPRFVKGDWPRLRQVLINLIGNAIKFTSHGSVRCSASGDGEGRVRFEVRDTGIGITEAQRATLFEPFTQADASTSRRFGGTGLGLSISRRLVQLMGGDITVTSADGVGSCFSFTLALEPGVAPALEAPGQARAAPARVLVVDDNEINLKLERALLERAGHTVSVARDGEEALLRLSSAHFDLVLLDLQMPVLDGYETARRVRDPGSSVLDHGVPIVALTANATVEDREACARAGFSDYLTKPITPQALWAAVARWSAAPQHDSDLNQVINT